MIATGKGELEKNGKRQKLWKHLFPEASPSLSLYRYSTFFFVPFNLLSKVITNYYTFFNTIKHIEILYDCIGLK